MASENLHSTLSPLFKFVQILMMPQRIISLVPSQTELLYDLGLDQEVVGITKFCIHPEAWFRTKTRVGGTKQVKMDIIHQLKPDLVIANKEENVKEQVEEIAKHYPVMVTDVNSLDDSLEMITDIGEVTGKKIQASNIKTQIKSSFSGLPTPDSKLKAIYLIWKSPYMTVGGDTFINAMLEAAGFENSCKAEKRYPEITIEQIRDHHPDLLLLSSEPYPFKQKHIDELAAMLPDTKILLVDGEMFSWYGSRLLQTPGYFEILRHKVQGTGHKN